MRAVSRRSWRLRSNRVIRDLFNANGRLFAGRFPFKAVSLPDGCEDVHTLWVPAVCARVRFVTIHQ